MKKNPTLLIAAGVVLLLLGALLSLTGGAPKADAALAQQCRQSMVERKAGADLVAQCDEVAFATAMTATNAQAAAQAISAANNSEVGGNALSKFLLGLGLALTVCGIVLKRKKTPTA